LDKFLQPQQSQRAGRTLRSSKRRRPTWPLRSILKRLSCALINGFVYWAALRTHGLFYANH